MALTEQTIISHIGILEDGQLQVRRSRRVFDDTGTMIAEQYHRHVVAPGDDVTNEDARVRAVAILMHTPTVVQAYRDQQAQNRTH